MPEEFKKNQVLTANSFNRLLEWFDEGENSDGRRYLEIRERLVSYFDRKNCLNPDELADETLNRVARRLEEEGRIESETPAKYCYITAKFVFLESLRTNEKYNVPLNKMTHQPPVFEDSGAENKLKETRLNCLEHCTDDLETANREIIFGYYFGAEGIKIANRRALAKKLDISVNALSIRACRIREKLQICVEKCVGKS